tara:strand:- start:239 stop:481 length:243 start_codon:yes stop_codon:yes gene_type:complete
MDKKMKEQEYIFERHLGGVEYSKTIHTYKAMMKRKQQYIDANILKKGDNFLAIFSRIIPLYEDKVKYKQDPINTKQMKLL